MQPASRARTATIPISAVVFILITLTGCFGGREWQCFSPLSTGEFFNYVENGGNKESADKGLGNHSSDYRRSHDLACYRTCSGSCPERHAAENKGERSHHEGPEAKPRRGKCRIGD